MRAGAGAEGRAAGFFEVEVGRFSIKPDLPDDDFTGGFFSGSGADLAGLADFLRPGSKGRRSDWGSGVLDSEAIGD
jgi:hypothetical protein